MTTLYCEAQDFQSVKHRNKSVSHSAQTESVDADGDGVLVTGCTQLDKARLALVAGGQS